MTGLVGRVTDSQNTHGQNGHIVSSSALFLTDRNKSSKVFIKMLLYENRQLERLKKYHSHCTSISAFLFRQDGNKRFAAPLQNAACFELPVGWRVGRFCPASSTQTMTFH